MLQNINQATKVAIDYTMESFEKSVEPDEAERRHTTENINDLSIWFTLISFYSMFADCDWRI